MKIISAQGQTCNKFWIYAKHIADCMENNERIIILTPDISIKDYDIFYKYNKISFPLYYIKLSKLIGYENYIKLLNILFGNKYISKFLKFVFYFIPGIDFIIATLPIYKSISLNKEKEKIIELFSPNPQIKSEVLEIFNPLKSKNKIICGVHIRRGDYSHYKNGKYLFTIQQYYSLMISMKNTFSDNQIIFFISSNEKIDLSAFVNCNCIVLPKTTASKDLFALSLCQYIIGPPSTFSAWASFCGNNLLYIVDDPDKEFLSTSFCKI